MAGAVEADVEEEEEAVVEEGGAVVAVLEVAQAADASVMGEVEAGADKPLLQRQRRLVLPNLSLQFLKMATREPTHLPFPKRRALALPNN